MDSSPITFSDLSIRYGKHSVLPIDKLDRDEVLAFRDFSLAGNLIGHIPKGARLEITHSTTFRKSDAKVVPFSKGGFAERFSLLHGTNTFQTSLLDSLGNVLCTKTFDIVYKSSFREWSETICIAFVLALIIRGLVLQAFWIPTASMEPTLLGELKDDQHPGTLKRSGDRILVNRFAYVADFSLDGRLPFKFKTWFAMPKRGDIVVFRYPNRNPLEPTRDFIKRVIGLPGDLVESVAGTVMVNGVALEEPYITEPSFDFSKKVPSDALFVMGDNRNNSSDSRYWGFVPLDNLKGQAIFVYMPFNRFGPIRSYMHNQLK